MVLGRFVSPADIDRRSLPNELRFNNQSYLLRNRGVARVDYVLGEVYWKCSIGESVSVMDFASGPDVISREQDAGEVNYSYSRNVRWAKIAAAFELPVDGPGGQGIPIGASMSRTAIGCGTIALVVGLVVLVVIVLAVAASSSGGGIGGPVFIGGGSSYRGGGTYSGGK